MIQTLRKIGTEENSQLDSKHQPKNPTVHIILSGERMNLPLRSGARISAFTIPVQHSA